MFYVVTALPDLQYANYAQYTTSITVSQYRNPSLSINNHCILTEMAFKDMIILAKLRQMATHVLCQFSFSITETVP